jgi:hypothetical protein
MSLYFIISLNFDLTFQRLKGLPSAYPR